jgi:hypothetical protein
MIKQLILSFTVVTVVLSTPAKTETFNVCQVQLTPDGFVALRSKPSVKGKLLARMRTGEMAVIDVKNDEYVQIGKWLLVSYHRLDGKDSKGQENWRFVAKGWAFTDFIDECG